MQEISIDKILKDLSKHDYFLGFKFRKRDCSFIKKNKNESEIIELQYWKGYDLSRDYQSIVIKPLHLKRFNILHKWFEKFSFKSIQDQRDNYSISFDGRMLNSKEEFHFLLNGKDYNDDFQLLITNLIKDSEYVFDKYKEINSLYEHFVLPVFNETKELPINGADWIFEYLTLTKIIEPHRFESLYKILKRHTFEMYKNQEPNLIEYYEQFDEIIDSLRNLKL